MVPRLELDKGVRGQGVELFPCPLAAVPAPAMLTRLCETRRATAHAFQRALCARLATVKRAGAIRLRGQGFADLGDVLDDCATVVEGQHPDQPVAASAPRPPVLLASRIAGARVPGREHVPTRACSARGQDLRLDEQRTGGVHRPESVVQRGPVWWWKS